MKKTYTTQDGKKREYHYDYRSVSISNDAFSIVAKMAKERKIPAWQVIDEIFANEIARAKIRK